MATSVMNMATTVVEYDSLKHQTESKFNFFLYSNLQLVFAQLWSPLVNMYIVFVGVWCTVTSYNAYILVKCCMVAHLNLGQSNSAVANSWPFYRKTDNTVAGPRICVPTYSGIFLWKNSVFPQSFHSFLNFCSCNYQGMP